jgi:chromosomal replication initiator protein
MIAFCSFSGRDLTTDLAHEVLGDLWGKEEKVITIDQIQKKVAESFSVSVSDLKAKTRTKAVALPRQIAMYVARQLTHASLAEIGRAFGGKDHTTVLHAVDKVQSLLQDDAKLRKNVESLIHSIKL